MKYRKNFFLCMAAAVILLSGCENAASLDQTGKQTALTDPVPSSDSTTEPTDLESNEVSVSIIPEQSAKPEIDYETFRGVEKDETPINTVNCKEFRPSLFCYGGGNTFFSWDGKVYKHDGETTEVLFGGDVYNLNYSDGVLYFIENDSYNVNDNNFVHIEGALCSYDLDEELYEIMTEFPVSQPVVNNGEIFYTDYASAGDPEPTGIYCLNKDGTSERLYDNMSYIEYGGYLLKSDWSDEERVYFSRDDEALLLENVHPYWDCIVGDYYYYRSNTDRTLNRLSMLTGEIITLKPYELLYPDPLFDDEESAFVCQDYTVLNDEIYLIDDYSALRRYNEATDSYTQINCEYAFRYIYADEENLYGVGCEREEESMTHTYYFVKLTLDGDTAEGEILA